MEGDDLKNRRTGATRNGVMGETSFCYSNAIAEDKDQSHRNQGNKYKIGFHRPGPDIRYTVRSFDSGQPDDKETNSEDEQESVKGAFDDVLKLGTYTAVLTFFYFAISLSLTSQLLFMVFGGARPHSGRLICTDTNGTVSEEPFGFTGKECADWKQRRNDSCEIKAEYKYGSIYEEFHLECHPHYAQKSTAYQNMGMILGAILGGASANCIGRKKTLVWFSVFLAVSELASMLAPTAAMFTLVRVFVMFFVAAIHNVSNLYFIENLPPKWRSILPTVVSYSLTYIVFAIIAQLCGEWKLLTLVSAFIAALCILLLLFLEETPSFLFSRTATGHSLHHHMHAFGLPKLGDSQPNTTILVDQKEKIERIYRAEAKKAAKRIDTYCCTKQSVDFEKKWRKAAIYHRRVTIAQEQMRRIKLPEEKQPSRGFAGQSLRQLFHNTELKRFTVVIAFCLFATSVVNYGTLLNVDALSGEIWTNIVMAGIMRYFVNFATILYELYCEELKRPLWAGRRPVHLICAGFVTAFLATIFFMDLIARASYHNVVWSATNRILAWLIISMCTQLFIIHQVQCSETFPTPVRAIGCGIVQSANRLGTAFGPFILSLANYSSSLPHGFMLFLFLMDLVLYSYNSFGACNSKVCAITETKGQPKREFMPGESNEEFTKALQQTHLSSAEYAEFGEPFILFLLRRVRFS